MSTQQPLKTHRKQSSAEVFRSANASVDEMLAEIRKRDSSRDEAIPRDSSSSSQRHYSGNVGLGINLRELSNSSATEPLQIGSEEKPEHVKLDDNWGSLKRSPNIGSLNIKRRMFSGPRPLPKGLDGESAARTHPLPHISQSQSSYAVDSLAQDRSASTENGHSREDVQRAVERLCRGDTPERQESVRSSVSTMDRKLSTRAVNKPLTSVKLREGIRGFSDDEMKELLKSGKAEAPADTVAPRKRPFIQHDSLKRLESLGSKRGMNLKTIDAEEQLKASEIKLPELKDDPADDDSINITPEMAKKATQSQAKYGAIGTPKTAGYSQIVGNFLRNVSGQSTQYDSHRASVVSSMTSLTNESDFVSASEGESDGVDSIDSSVVLPSWNHSKDGLDDSDVNTDSSDEVDTTVEGPEVLHKRNNTLQGKELGLPREESTDTIGRSSTVVRRKKGDASDNTTPVKTPVKDIAIEKIPEKSTPIKKQIKEAPTKETPTKETPTEVTPTKLTPTKLTPTEVTPVKITPTKVASTKSVKATLSKNTSETSTSGNVADISSDKTLEKEDSIKNALSKNTSVKDASTKDSLIKDVPSKSVSTKDISVKDASAKDLSSTKAFTKEVSVKEASIKEASGKVPLTSEKKITPTSDSSSKFNIPKKSDDSLNDMEGTRKAVIDSANVSETIESSTPVESRSSSQIPSLPAFQHRLPSMNSSATVIKNPMTPSQQSSRVPTPSYMLDVKTDSETEDSGLDHFQYDPSFKVSSSFNSTVRPPQKPRENGESSPRESLLDIWSQQETFRRVSSHSDDFQPLKPTAKALFVRAKPPKVVKVIRSDEDDDLEPVKSTKSSPKLTEDIPADYFGNLDSEDNSRSWVRQRIQVLPNGKLNKHADFNDSDDDRIAELPDESEKNQKNVNDEPQPKKDTDKIDKPAHFAAAESTTVGDELASLENESDLDGDHYENCTEEIVEDEEEEVEEKSVETVEKEADTTEPAIPRLPVDLPSLDPQKSLSSSPSLVPASLDDYIDRRLDEVDSLEDIFTRGFTTAKNSSSKPAVKAAKAFSTPSVDSTKANVVTKPVNADVSQLWRHGTLSKNHSRPASPGKAQEYLIRKELSKEDFAFKQANDRAHVGSYIPRKAGQRGLVVDQDKEADVRAISGGSTDSALVNDLAISSGIPEKVPTSSSEISGESLVDMNSKASSKLIEADTSEKTVKDDSNTLHESGKTSRNVSSTSKLPPLPPATLKRFSMPPLMSKDKEVSSNQNILPPQQRRIVSDESSRSRRISMPSLTALAKRANSVEPVHLIDGEQGRLFLRLKDLHNLKIAGITARNAKMQVVLDNGIHTVSTGFVDIKESVVQINKEFELIVPEKLQLIITLKLKYDKPEEELVEVTERKKVKSKSFFGRLFGIKNVIKTTRYVNKPAKHDPLSGIVATDGSFAKIKLDFNRYRPLITGEVASVDLQGFNEWKVVPQPFNICSIATDMLFVPRSSQYEVLPVSIDNAYDQIANVRKVLKYRHQGYMYQEGGDMAVWTRRFFKLKGLDLFAYNEDTMKLKAKINLRRVVDIIYPGKEENSNTANTTSGGKRIISETLILNDGFKLTFANEESINFGCESKQERTVWVHILEDIILKNNFRRQPWVKLMTRKSETRDSELPVNSPNVNVN